MFVNSFFLLILALTFISTLYALKSYPGEKLLNGTSCIGMNGFILLNSCIYVLKVKMNVSLGNGNCTANGGRLIHLPNSTYATQYNLLNLTNNDTIYLGMYKPFGMTASSYTWIAGNTSETVTYNEFGLIQNITQYAVRVVMLGASVWKVSGGTNPYTIVCQHCLEEINVSETTAVTTVGTIQPTTPSSFQHSTKISSYSTLHSTEKSTTIVSTPTTSTAPTTGPQSSSQEINVSANSGPSTSTSTLTGSPSSRTSMLVSDSSLTSSQTTVNNIQSQPSTEISSQQIITTGTMTNDIISTLTADVSPSSAPISIHTTIKDTSSTRLSSSIQMSTQSETSKSATSSILSSKAEQTTQLYQRPTTKPSKPRPFPNPMNLPQTCIDWDENGNCLLIKLYETYIDVLTNEAFDDDCGYCISSNTIQCNLTSKFSCVCNEDYTGHYCQVYKYVCPEKTCFYGKCLYNKPKREFNCTCDQGFEGLKCTDEAPLSESSVYQIIGRVERRTGCAAVIIVLSIVIIFQILFDRIQPFFLHKIQGNLALFLAHTLLFFHQRPNGLSVENCNLVAVTIGYLHAVHFTMYFLISRNIYVVCTGCVNMYERFVLKKELIMGWIVPLFLYTTIYNLRLGTMATLYSCLANVDGWIDQYRDLACMIGYPCFIITLMLINVEATGQESWIVYGCLEIVNKQQLMVGKSTREWMYPWLGNIMVFASWVGNMFILRSAQDMAYSITFVTNIFFITTMVFFQIMCHPTVYLKFAAFVKFLFGRYCVRVRNWDPLIVFIPQRPILRPNVQKQIDRIRDEKMNAMMMETVEMIRREEEEEKKQKEKEARNEVKSSQLVDRKSAASPRVSSVPKGQARKRRGGKKW